MKFSKVLSFLTLLLTSAGMASADADKLIKIDEDLKQSFANIGHLSTEDLAASLETSAPILLVDVRKATEYSVGRIPGAIRIRPNASAKDVAEAIGDDAAGKDVIFYCSVGVRSSRIASRAEDAMKQAGARGVYNLSGGIFAWHNEARHLENDSGETGFVHPYNKSWGKLLNRQAFVSTRPEPRHAE